MDDGTEALGKEMAGTAAERYGGKGKRYGGKVKRYGGKSFIVRSIDDWYLESVWRYRRWEQDHGRAAESTIDTISESASSCMNDDTPILIDDLVIATNKSPGSTWWWTNSLQS